MNTKPLMLALTSAVVLLCGPAAPPVSAQFAPPPSLPTYQPLSDVQLDQLLGPIALYPDPLLAQILPAATLPTQIVLADRYVAGGGDPNLVYEQPWDASVQALTHYPAVLQYLDNNLAWTTQLGEAFLYQQQQVMESIQRLRLSAQNYGNLQSTPQQQVVYDNGEIEILPAEPDVIYVPVYQPEVVYYQSGFGLGFGVACTFGPWLNCDFDWIHHNLHFWDRQHPRPANWWHERPAQREAWIAQQAPVWRAEDHRGADRHGARGDRGWDNDGARGRNNSGEHASQQNNNNTVVNMSRPATVPRPAATPTPPASPRTPVVRDSGAFHLGGDRSAPSTRPGGDSAPNGAFIGSESSHEVRNFSDRGQQSMQSAVHSEPAHPAFTPSEPARSAPPVSHSEPQNQGGGNEGGGSHGGGGQPHR